MKKRLHTLAIVLCGLVSTVSAQTTCVPGWKVTDWRINNQGGATDTQLSNTTEAKLIATYGSTGRHGPHNVSALRTETRTVIDMDSSATFPINNPFPNGTGNDIVLKCTTFAKVPPGTYTVGFGCDDGGSLKMRQTFPTGNLTFSNRVNGNGSPAADELLKQAGGGFNWTTGVFTVSQETIFEVTLIYWERSGSDNIELAGRVGSHSGPATTAAWTLIGNSTFGWELCQNGFSTLRPATLGKLEAQPETTELPAVALKD